MDYLALAQAGLQMTGGDVLDFNDLTRTDLQTGQVTTLELIAGPILEIPPD